MFGEDVAWLTRSAAERGDVADFERSMKDSRAFRAFCCVGSMAMVGVTADSDVTVFVGQCNAYRGSLPRERLERLGAKGQTGFKGTQRAKTLGRILLMRLSDASSENPPPLAYAALRRQSHVLRILLLTVRRPLPNRYHPPNPARPSSPLTSALP